VGGGPSVIENTPSGPDVDRLVTVNTGGFAPFCTTTETGPDGKTDVNPGPRLILPESTLAAPSDVKNCVVVGVIVGLVGLAVLVGPASLSGKGEVDSAGAIVLILGSLAWAAGSVFNRHGSRPDSAAMSTGLQMIGGSIALLLLGVMRGELAQLHVREISAASWAGWIYLVTFGSLVGFTAYIYLLQTVSPAKASTYAYVNPLVAVLLGWAIAGESVTVRSLGAAAIILAGVAMITISQSPGYVDSGTS